MASPNCHFFPRLKPWAEIVAAPDGTGFLLPPEGATQCKSPRLQPWVAETPASEPWKGETACPTAWLICWFTSSSRPRAGASARFETEAEALCLHGRNRQAARLQGPHRQWHERPCAHALGGANHGLAGRPDAFCEGKLVALGASGVPRQKKLWLAARLCGLQRESVEIPDVYRYIERQEEHHKKVSFKEELVAFLKRHQIEYDERYVWS